MIVVLAGRRIDAPDAKVRRFPPGLAGLVKQRLIDSLKSVVATHLVSSGACGADLLAMEAASELKIDRTMILPFDATTFRSTSVTDRPGDWGMIYDKFIQELKPDKLITLGYDQNDPEVYERTNFEILDYAEKIAEKINATPPAQKNTVPGKLALIVWEGKPKDADDTTYHFLKEAQKRNFKIREIRILE